jgi:hypothetical protein
MQKLTLLANAAACDLRPGGLASHVFQASAQRHGLNFCHGTAAGRQLRAADQRCPGRRQTRPHPDRRGDLAQNHSFDNLYGLFPGANGISPPEQKTQLDHDGKPLKELITFGDDGKPDPKFPRLPNAPSRIDAPPVNRPPTQIVPSPVHAFFS